MKSFRKILIKPLRSLPDLNLKTSESKQIDLSHLSPEDLEIKMNLVYDLLRKTGEGILFLKDEGEKPYVGSLITSSKNKKKIIVAQEPNPVHIYYKIANEHLEIAYNIRGIIISEKNFSTYDNYNLLIDYIKEVSQGIIFLVTTIEAFINQIIPEDQIFLEGSINHSTGEITVNKSYNKEEIGWFPFDKKLKRVIPAFFKEELIASLYQENCEKLIKINKLRNDLIHLKVEVKKNLTSHESLNKKLIDFDSFIASEITFQYIEMICPNYFTEEKL